MRRSLLFLCLLAAVAAAPANAQVNATIDVNDMRQQGTHASGRPLLFTPDPVQGGSSVSHWDRAAFPNLLMEPAINADLPFLGLDATPGQMADVFWPGGTLGVNIFAADDGFFDATPFGGAPGNPAATLGEARQNVFNAVLGTWANTLGSNVPVDVLVFWQDLPCGLGGAVLGAAGTFSVFGLEDPSSGFSVHWFHSALAESLIGDNLTGPPEEGNFDIFVLMNSALDDECLGPGTGWYYGLDGNNPAGQVDQAPVVLHELAHGLGFSNFSNDSSGELFLEIPGIYDFWTFDETTGLFFDQMNDAQRAAAARKFRQVTWAGPFATLAAQALLDAGVPELVVNAPASVAGTYEATPAAFGPGIPAGGLTGDVACMKDAVPDINYLNGCTPATNPGELAGKIALIDRGGCAFTDKVANAQAAGAIGAIVVNNAGSDIFAMGGDDPSITIPSVMVPAKDGNRIRQEACPGAAAFLMDDRFQVNVDWATATANGAGNAEMLTDLTGYFWFFNPENVEMTVKVIDACDLEGFNNFWVFAAGMTDVEVTLTVVDTTSGAATGYISPLGSPFPPITDTNAFATCP